MKPTDWSVVDPEPEPSPIVHYPVLTTLLLVGLAAGAVVLVTMLVTGWRP